MKTDSAQTAQRVYLDCACKFSKQFKILYPKHRAGRHDIARQLSLTARPHWTTRQSATTTQAPIPSVNGQLPKLVREYLLKHIQRGLPLFFISQHGTASQQWLPLCDATEQEQSSNRTLNIRINTPPNVSILRHTLFLPRSPSPLKCPRKLIWKHRRMKPTA